MPILQLTMPEGKQLTINARRESIVVMENNDTTFTFDYEGRLIGAFLEGRNYRRSLANEILEKQNGARPGLASRLRRTLSPRETKALETRAYDFAHAVADQIEASGAVADAGAIESVREALERVGHYDFARLEHERATYQHIYRPVTILPPDQYLALVLQATEGCTFNRCAFCGFYRDRRFRVKPLDEFRQHIRDVRAFFGGSLSLRRSLFLGDANALMIPQTTLVPLFDAINAEFAILPRGLDKAAEDAWKAAHPIHLNGVYSFIDAFATRCKVTRDFQELGERGLRRVYVGLETGDPELLQFLGKPNSPSDAVQLICHAKAGGVAVGIIVLVGAGGDQFQEAHIRETTRVINALPLDENDLIYFSELVDYPGSTYSALALEANIRPLTLGEIEHQMMRLRAGFEFRCLDHAPKISYYDIREFVY
jgi:hypothetical protein